jgi:hypothetical protein
MVVILDCLKPLPNKIRKDAVVAIELVLSMTPEWFDGLTEDRHALRQHPKFIEWVDTSIAWARKELGQNVIDVAVHMDESSPHMHVLAVPLTQDGRLVDFPSAQAVQELARGQQQGPGREPGR